MRRVVLALVAGAVLLVLGVAQATATGTTYGFNLTGPNFAENSGNGDVIRVTGSGTFNPSMVTATGSGSFTHRHSDGALVAKGTWVATGFTGFTSYGGPSNGFQGGSVRIVVRLFPSGGGSVPGVAMTVTCHVGTVPGGAPEEGTMVDGLGFTESIGGFTLMHIVS